MSPPDFLSPVLFPESMLVMSFVISMCRWLCGYGWQLLMKSTPSQILPDFKPCHALPLMSSAQSEAAVTFWSLRFPFPSPQGLSEKITWCWWLQLLIFQTAVSDLSLPGPATLFFPHHHWMPAIWGRIKYLWGVDPQAVLPFYVSGVCCFLGSLAEEHWGSVRPSCWWVAELAAEKESFDASFFYRMQKWRGETIVNIILSCKTVVYGEHTSCLPDSAALKLSFVFMGFFFGFFFFNNACR